MNAPGRDPIVTREIWLEGTEEQNANARERAIYIHGTPEENMIGKPMSWGCIRMRSEDVIALYDQVGTGTEVDITEDRLPHLHKYRPPPPPPPPPPAPEPVVKEEPKVKEESKAKEEPKPAQLARIDVKPNVKQVSQPQIVGEKPLAAKASAEKAASHSTISHDAPVVAFHDADNTGQETTKSTYNPDAWKAMKGSILMAGLPGAPGLATAPKTPPVALQQTAAPTGK